MTIGKGEPWGVAYEGPADSLRLLRDDPCLAVVAYQSHLAGQGQPLLQVAKGDLLRTLGLQAPRSDSLFSYCCDLGLAECSNSTGSVPIPFVAHLVVGPWFRQQHVIFAMNTPWLGSYRLGPKAHPNDARLDLTEGWIPLQQWPEASRRAKSGSHLPHPGLNSYTGSEFNWSFGVKRPVWADGRFIGRFSAVYVQVLADIFTIVG